jgi:hypothetical protein
MIRPSVGRDGRSLTPDLGFGKTEIFLQTGLDKVMQESASDLPVGRQKRVERILQI